MTDDMTDSIAPKSDQMNAEDLLSGPRTFTITRVRVTETPDQPVHVYLDGFPSDRPFKPSKTVRRLMVVAWGADSTAYVGKRLTLFRDPAVRFGGMDVGGIRVSHMSGLTGPLNVALAVTRGRRAPYTVDPLPDQPAARPQQRQPGPSLPDRVERMIGGFAPLGVTEDDLARRIGRPRAGWAEDDLNRMTEVYTAMHRGELIREEAFPRSEVTADDLPPDPAAGPASRTDPHPAAAAKRPADTAQLTALTRALSIDGADRLLVFSAILGRNVTATRQLTADDAAAIAAALQPIAEDQDRDARAERVVGMLADGQIIRDRAQ